MIPSALRRGTVGLVLGGLLASGAVLAAPHAAAEPLGDAKARATGLRAQVDQLREQAEIATESYDETYHALGLAVNAHLQAQRELDAARQDSGTTDDQRTLRARALYMSGGASALYASVLSSGSITEVTNRIHQVRVVLDGDAKAVHQADSAVSRLSLAEQRLSDSARRATQLQKKVADQSQQVRGLLAQTTALLAEADQQVLRLAEEQRQAAAAAAAARAAAALAAARGAGLDLPDVPASEVAGVALAFARSQLGKPYLWGATGPDAYDCSGLTGAAYRAAGIELPRTSRQQWYAGPHVGLGQLEPGDLLFWGYDVTDPATIHHVAIYAGQDLMVAAPHAGDVVKVQPVYLDGYLGAVRPGAPAPDPSTSTVAAQ